MKVKTDRHRTSPVPFMVILGIAVAYFALARFGMLLAIPPGYASAIWPPAGLALAVALQWGYRVWGGVFLGSFAANLWTGLDAGNLLFSNPTVLSAVIGAGAALQTVTGAYLISRFVGFPVTLDRERKVVLFLLLGGPLSCLVNATSSVTALLIAGTISPHEFVFSWFTWWIGDAMGAMVVTPALLSFSQLHGEIWKRRKTTVTLPLCGFLLLLISLYIVVSHREQHRIEEEFKLKAELISNQIKEMWGNYLDALYSAEAFFSGSAQVNRSEFTIFARHWLSRHRGIQALEWVPRVRHPQRPAYEAAARRDGFPDFRITEIMEKGKGVERAPRPEYFPVYFVEPFKGNELALGFDLASNENRLKMLHRASSTGKPAGTGRVTLVQERAGQYGFLVAMPIHDPPVIDSGETSPAESLKGFVLGVFRFGDAMPPVRDQADAREIRIHLTDLTADPGQQLLYDSGVDSRAEGRTETEIRSEAPASAWLTTVMEIAGQRWQISLSPTAGYLAGHRSLQAWSVLAGGLLFSTIACVYLLVMTGRAARIEALVKEKTHALELEIAGHRQTEKALRESEGNYREIFNATSDGLSIHDETGRFLEANDRGCEIPGYDRSELLGLSVNDITVGEPPYSATEIVEKIHQTIEEGPQLFEWHCKRGNGELFWAEVALKACEIGGIRRLVASVRDVTDRKRAEETLKAALMEKEVLLREVHHRVKNNMQVISGLLSLQAERLENEPLRQALIESQQRIMAMSLIHQALHSGQRLSTIDLSAYLNCLVQYLREMYHSEADVGIALESETVELGIDQAVPCGLILNELITNSLKHAFPDQRKGEIRIKISLTDEREVVLVVSDDGVGLNTDLYATNPSTLGLRLVQGLLTHQLKGHVDVSVEGGTAFTICWPLPPGEGENA